jgi:hypothetical protein
LFVNIDDLIASIVFKANKISFLDKILINHRIEKDSLLTNSNEINFNIFYF